ncbi:DUF3176 domain-containing protein [Candidatus Bathyarchaeota archaeon]|nr:DUF3176 domain-containing protein [Candidatus Bathyarchaeota archaeon]
MFVFPIHDLSFSTNQPIALDLGSRTNPTTIDSDGRWPQSTMATAGRNGSPDNLSHSRLLPGEDGSGPAEDGHGRLDRVSTASSEHASPADAEKSTPSEPSRGVFLASLSPWKWELVSLFTGYAVLAAIFVTLSQYDGKDLPEWPYSLNLNSLVAIYTTILRALLLFPVAEGKQYKKI